MSDDGRSRFVIHEIHRRDAVVEAEQSSWTGPMLATLTEWTGDGQHRHPRRLGLREDKNPADMVREEPAAFP